MIPPVPELPADIRRLFEEERALVPLPGAARARVAARLAQAAPLPTWSERALRLARRSGWVTVVFLAGAGAGAGFEHRRNAGLEARPIATVAVAARASAAQGPGDAPTASHEPVTEEPAHPEVAAAPPTAAKTSAPTPRPPSRAPSSLADERAEIETARVAMTRARWDEAAAALDRHAATSPNGQLAEERESLHVVLLAARGDGFEARRAAARFERLHATSLFLPAVRAAADSVTDAPGTGQVIGEPKGR